MGSGAPSPLKSRLGRCEFCTVPNSSENTKQDAQRAGFCTCDPLVPNEVASAGMLDILQPATYPHRSLLAYQQNQYCFDCCDAPQWVANPDVTCLSPTLLPRPDLISENSRYTQLQGKVRDHPDRAPLRALRHFQIEPDPTGGHRSIERRAPAMSHGCPLPEQAASLLHHLC